MRCKLLSPSAAALRVPGLEEADQDRLEVGFEHWVKLPASTTRVHCPLASCLSLLFANHTVVDHLVRELAVPSSPSVMWLRLCTTAGSDDLFEGDGGHTWGKKIAPFLLWAFLFMGAVWFVCFFSTLLFWDGAGERAREAANPTATATSSSNSGTIKKFCPRCRVLIQKIGGCDKMQCTGCGTRFSWAQAEVAFATTNPLPMRDVEASPVSCSAAAPPRPVVLPVALQAWVREHEHYVRLGDEGGGEDGGGGAEVCVVCKDRRCDWRFQGCGHSMCQTCMARVLSASGRCPFDRTVVEAAPIPLT